MSKTEVENCKKIEIWWLMRDIKKKGGYKYTTISWGENGSGGSVSVQVSVCNEEKYVMFIYTQTDNHTQEKKDFQYKVPVITTPCHYGGIRYWFKCQLSVGGVYCGRRVGVLYKDGDWFGCRHCYNLTYASRNVNRRYYLSSVFRVFDFDEQIDKLYKKTKRYTYAGKPTKTMRKINRLNKQMEHYFLMMDNVMSKVSKIGRK